MHSDKLILEQNRIDANKFRSILNNFSIKIHLNKATHNLGHILDLVIDCVDKSIVGCVNVERQKTITDHMVVNLSNFEYDIPKKRP